MLKCRYALSLATVLLASLITHAAPVTGRYVTYGNALSPRIGLAELEVWSGETNLMAGKTDNLTLRAVVDEKTLENLPSHWRNLTDGNTNTLDRWPKTCELYSAGISTYSDTTLSYPALEVDLGEMVPIDRIEVYRSRIRLDNGTPWKLPSDLGWRYILVLNEAREIVAWHVFNAYEEGWLEEKKGHWTIVPEPATGAPAGRVVPDKNCWLSEAEFIRDFLGKPIIDNSAPRNASDRQRLAAFAKRNSPEAIADLGRAFFPTVDLERPGMGEVKRLVAEERFGEALEAFKVPFFSTISALPELFTGFEYAWEYVPDSRIDMRSSDLANGLYADKEALTVTRFRAGLLPPASSVKQMRPLLQTYSGTNNPDYLRSWEALTDDWAIGFQSAADADPSLRNYFVLSGKIIQDNLMDLHNAAADNPNFVRELSGATLARFLMPIVEEIPVALWRVDRTSVFNHTFNSIPSGWICGRVLADFRAGQRLEREMRQGLMRLYTKAQYRDGPMVELGDEGHFAAQYGSPARLYGLMVAQISAESPESAWLSPAREAYFLDNLRQAELQAVRHTAPAGVAIRWPTRRLMHYPAMGGRGDDGPGNTVVDVAAYLQKLSVMMEPESRAVIQSVYGPPLVEGDKPTRIETALAERHFRDPEIVSDWLPYAGSWYFRGGWELEDSFLHMLKPSIANNYGGGFYNVYIRAFERFNPTSFRFTDYATPLVTVFGTEIDRQRPNDTYGRYPSGSKQEAFTRAVEKPQPRRWFTNEVLDFGEAVFEGTYHNVYRYRDTTKVGTKEEITYEDDPLTINGVRTTRQIIQVRPARLFLQIERVRYASSDETHTNRFPLTFTLTEPGEETGKTFSSDQLTIDAKRHTITTRNPGNPGVTAIWFGQEEMSFKPYSVNSSAVNFWPQPDPELVDPEADAMLSADSWGKGWDTLNGPRRTSGRGVMASWQATGHSVVLAALRANAPGDEPIQHREDLSTETVAGLRIRTRERYDKTVELLVARDAPATLTLGDIEIRGEALLVVQTPRWKTTNVLLLGAKRLTIAGQPVDLPAEDVVFDLSPEDVPTILEGSLEQIPRPLDPPTIGPAAGVFADSTEVVLSTSSPDTMIRYTTETPRSRLAEFRRAAEDVLSGRLTATQAAEQLARRQEEGREWQEYTGPFTITDDTLVRARTFRRGHQQVPMLKVSGDEVSAISYGFFTKSALKPAEGGLRMFKGLKPGLTYDYLEGRWFALWSYADILPATSSGTTDSLMDVSMRSTDDSFAVRYHGYIDIPEGGVYTFHAPTEYIDNSCAPGYDLRVFVDGEEWLLRETWHGRGTWSIPLAKGLHRFMVTFADARARDLENQRVDLWGRYPEPRTTWRGTTPQLDISGPNLTRQSIPNNWLKHR